MNTLNLFGRAHKELDIDQKLETALWSTKIDAGQINQVLLNLFVNAGQAMPRGGKMVVRSENITLDEGFVKVHNVAPGRFVKLSVTDTGLGMDRETLGRIFDPFFTTRDVGEGTGLGLSSVYGIVDNHGGFITVESKVGEGTSFDIYLPATEEVLVEIEEVVREERKGSGTIMYVDDEPAVAAVVQRFLEELGYDVLVAHSGDAALERYRQNMGKIDLVILDMIMPGISGGDVFDKLRELNPNVKVLLSSGYGLEGQAKEIMDRGCNGFVQKPFSLNELSEKIHEITDQK